jgi:hypothetical protein
MSQCINSKGEQETEFLCKKGNLCCLAMGQTVQTLLESKGMEGTIRCKRLILDDEGCPDL